MEGEQIGLVLARASELRSKINGCIGGSDDAGGRTVTLKDDDEEEKEEARGLVGVRDALDSLERQLAALQALQHQQRYERESILAQIDHSRVILLSKLKEYKGVELEVIHKVSAFAGEAVEPDDGLVLPPYPTHLPDLFVLDDISAGSRFMMKNKPSCNGPISNTKHEGKGTACETDKTQGKKKSKGIRHVIGFIFKSAITFVSVMSVLSFAGYQPMFKKGPRFMLLFGGQAPRAIQCPQGKLLVVEGEKARCIAKERIEVPFDSDVKSLNISYGFG